MENSHENLKVIRFEGEMLPNWAQLLDLAARLCPVAAGTRKWFSLFTNSSGVDDARTVATEAGMLLIALQGNKQTVVIQLQRTRGDGQASRIFAAWEYSLETMIQVASSRKSCAWIVEGMEAKSEGDFGDGDITLRRV